MFAIVQDMTRSLPSTIEDSKLIYLFFLQKSAFKGLTVYLFIWKFCLSRVFQGNQDIYGFIDAQSIVKI